MNLFQIICWRNRYVKQKYVEKFMEHVMNWENTNGENHTSQSLQYCYYLSKKENNEKNSIQTS